MTVAAICALLGVPTGSGASRATGPAAGPPPSPCLVGTACTTVTVNLTTPYGSFSPGSGRVTSEPAGIDCTAKRGVQSGVCSYTFSWRPSSGSDTLDIVVKATAAGDSWTSPSTAPYSLGNTDSRVFTVPSDNAYFVQVNSISFNLARWPVKVTKTGAGTGRVSSANGIDCGSVCEVEVDHQKTVALTAKPDAGAVFKTWTGACNGQGATCTLTVTRAASTNAVFDVKPPLTTTTTTTTTSTTAADRSVDASLLATRAGRSRLGVRVVEVELTADEDLAVPLTLVRKGKKLALKEFARVKEGPHVLTLVLTRTLKQGLATIRIEANDSAGNRRVWTRTVRIPARTKVIR